MSTSERSKSALAILSDDALLAKIADGNQAAFALISERHAERAFALAVRTMGDRAAAEDAVQEAFIRVWKHAPKWETGKARFSTWLYRVVVNVCIDAKRKQKGIAVDIDDVPEPAAPATQEASLMAEDRAAALDAALAKLPERQRAALTLCYLQGHSNKDAAEILDVGVKALESLLSRGRAALKEILQLSEEAAPLEELT